MRWWWHFIALGASVLFLLILAYAHPVWAGECLHSAEAVRALHRGAWPSWHGSHRSKCWFADWMHRHSASPGSTATSQQGRSRGPHLSAMGRPAAPPLPRARPDVELLIALRQPKVPLALRNGLVEWFDEIMKAAPSSIIRAECTPMDDDALPLEIAVTGSRP